MAAEVPIIRPAEVADLSAIERIYGHYVTNTTASFELEPPDVSDWRDRFALVSAAGLPFVVAELPAVAVAVSAVAAWWPASGRSSR
jgi:phosphinothricin acetyltransferase